MRTGTFSNQQVIKTVGSNFVCGWQSTKPLPGADSAIGKLMGELNKEIEKNATGPINGLGVGNISTVFMTPDEKILHVLHGRWDVEEFLEEVRFVLELKNKVCAKDLTLVKDAGAVYKKMHLEHAERHLKRYKDKKEMGQRILATLHEELASRPFEMIDNDGRSAIKGMMEHLKDEIERR